MKRRNLPTFSDEPRWRESDVVVVIDVHLCSGSATVVRLPAAVVAQWLRRASSVRLSPFRNRFVAAVDLSSGSRVLN